MSIGHLAWILFGPGAWGTGGNLVAWVLCGVLAGLWLRGKLRAQTALARLHHQQRTDQAQAHHEDMKAHVTAVATLAVAADTAGGTIAPDTGHLTDQRESEV